MLRRWQHRLSRKALGSVFGLKGYRSTTERGNHPSGVRKAEDVLSAGAFDPIGGVDVTKAAAGTATTRQSVKS